MIRLVLCVSLLLALGLYASAAQAEASFQFSFAGAQMPSDPNVNGVKLVLLYGENENVKGLDLGFASVNVAQNRSGFAAIMGVGTVRGTSSGCAASLMNVHYGQDTGVNAAFINIVKEIKKGVNLGFVNLTDGFSSVDVGGLSVSSRSNTQVGFLNVTDEITHVQIGLLNIAGNGMFPVFPFFNVPKK
jgi:hypothetical protein